MSSTPEDMKLNDVDLDDYKDWLREELGLDESSEDWALLDSLIEEV